jgi:hypothetical protein
MGVILGMYVCTVVTANLAIYVVQWNLKKQPNRQYLPIELHCEKPSLVASCCVPDDGLIRKKHVAVMKSEIKTEHLLC